MGSLQKSEPEKRSSQMPAIRGNNGLVNLAPELERLCKIIYQCNQLRPYPLTAMEIAEYADSLLRLIPDLNFEKVEFMVDQMLLGNIEWDTKLGIQNLTNGLKVIGEAVIGLSPRFYLLKQGIW